MKKGPKIEPTILERRPGQNEPVTRPNRKTGTGYFRGRVLDHLPFIENRIAEFRFRQKIAMPTQLRVTGEPNPIASLLCEGRTAPQNMDLHFRIKARQFLFPNRYHARRSDDEMSFLRRRPRRKKRNNLNRFSESHLISQKRVTVDIEQMRHPLNPFALIIPQKLRQSPHRFGRRKQFLPPLVEFVVDLQFNPIFGKKRQKHVSRNRFPFSW